MRRCVHVAAFVCAVLVIVRDWVEILEFSFALRGGLWVFGGCGFCE